MPDETVQTQTPTAPEPTRQDPFAGSEQPEWAKAAGVKADDGTPIQEQQKQAVQKTEPTQQQTTQTVPQQQPSGTIDPKVISEAVAAGVGAVLKQQTPAQQERQLTQEEIDAQLGVVRMSDADYEELLGVKPDSPARVEKLNKIIQGVVKQAVTTASVLYNGDLQKLRSSMDPYINLIRTQEAERQRKEFFTENKDLEGYDALVTQVFNSALQQGKTFPDVKAARKFVADTTRALLQKSGIQPVQPQTTQQTTQPQTSSRQMTTTSVGGRNGGSGEQKPKSTVSAVWGE